MQTVRKTPSLESYVLPSLSETLSPSHSHFQSRSLEVGNVRWTFVEFRGGGWWVKTPRSIDHAHWQAANTISMDASV